MGASARPCRLKSGANCRCSQYPGPRLVLILPAFLAVCALRKTMVAAFHVAGRFERRQSLTARKGRNYNEIRSFGRLELAWLGWLPAGVAARPSRRSRRRTFCVALRHYGIRSAPGGFPIVPPAVVKRNKTTDFDIALHPLPSGPSGRREAWCGQRGADSWLRARIRVFRSR